VTNTLNFSDMGYDVTGPTPTSSQQVHANGEIWSKTNFQIRMLLADKYDDDFPFDDEDLQYACANGELPAYACPGNRRWIQLVFDAMLMMPPDATMLQARDAALAADLARFGGANQRELWLGYARGGMGVAAVTTNSSGLSNAAGVESDTDPTPSFEPLGTTPATVRFRAENLDGDPINARIYVGHFEARVSPIADTNPATVGAADGLPGSNLDDTAKFAPGTYEFTAHAPGYGVFRFRDTFRRGENETITVEMAQNWASSASGATATGDGASLANLIDDTESTQWEAAGNATGPLTVDGKQVTIDLGGTEPINIKYVQVSAMLRSGQNRMTALRQFEVWTCNNGGAKLSHNNPPTADCSTAAGFTKRYTSPADAFPANAPRPVSPHLILRQFDIPDTKATHVRFVVRTSQCTGGPAFQGDQDADPTNNANCPTANVPPVGPATKFVRAAEFQVFRMHSDFDD